MARSRSYRERLSVAGGRSCAALSIAVLGHLVVKGRGGDSSVTVVLVVRERAVMVIPQKDRLHLQRLARGLGPRSALAGNDDVVCINSDEAVRIHSPELEVSAKIGKKLPRC